MILTLPCVNANNFACSCETLSAIPSVSSPASSNSVLVPRQFCYSFMQYKRGKWFLLASAFLLLGYICSSDYAINLRNKLPTIYFNVTIKIVVVTGLLELNQDITHGVICLQTFTVLRWMFTYTSLYRGSKINLSAKVFNAVPTCSGFWIRKYSHRFVTSMSFYNEPLYITI